MLLGSGTKFRRHKRFFFVSDVDGIRHKIWNTVVSWMVEHPPQKWKHPSCRKFLCRMLMGSDTKFGNITGFCLFCPVWLELVSHKVSARIF